MSFKEVIVAGSKLVREAIQSPNFQTGVSGWSINRDGSAEFNNLLARGTIQVGTTQNIEIGVVGGAAEINFNSGLAGETIPGVMAQSTFVQPVSGATEADIIIQSPVYNNGGTVLTIKPPDTQDIALFQVQTFGTTSPPGTDGLTGAMIIGSPTIGTDVWQLIVTNENSVIDPGPTIGRPPFVLGNNTQSRLMMSVSELLILDGTNTPSTLFLNSNNAQSVVGGVVNLSQRQQSTVNLAAFTPGVGAYTAHQQISGTLCPASGTMTVWLRFQVTGNTGFLTSDFVAGAIQIDNITQGTTPFAASDNRCATVGGTWLNSTTQNITLMTEITATGLGNYGDSLTVSAQFKNNSNALTRFYNVNRVELGVIPSF